MVISHSLSMFFFAEPNESSPQPVNMRLTQKVFHFVFFLDNTPEQSYKIILVTCLNILLTYLPRQSSRNSWFVTVIFRLDMIRHHTYFFLLQEVFS
jgi:hypothetical protein